MGVACWFPMGLRDERIVRLAAREASLLNSRCAVSWQCSDDSAILMMGAEAAACSLPRQHDGELSFPSEQLC